MAYAESTSVPVERSRAEVERLLTKYGATDFGYINRPDSAHLMFRASDRNVMFKLTYPKAGERNASSKTSIPDATDSSLRSRSTSADERLFRGRLLAQIVLPGGRTVGEEIRGNILEAYKHNSNVPLLPAWGGKPTE